MTFVQTIEVDAADIGPIQDLVSTWHAEQAGVAPGYERARILADEGRPNRYLIEVSFSSKEEAEANNARAETANWARRLEGIAGSAPVFTNLALVCTTD